MATLRRSWRVTLLALLCGVALLLNSNALVGAHGKPTSSRTPSAPPTTRVSRQRPTTTAPPTDRGQPAD